MDQNYYMNNKASSLSVSSLMNYIFMSTVKTAAKTLVSVVGAVNSTSYYDGDGNNGDEYQKWKLIDHFRYMMMLMIWFTLWILRLLMDYFPCSLLFNPPPPITSSPNYILDHGFSSSSSSYHDLSSSSSSSSSLDLVLHEGYGNGYYDYDDASSSPQTKAIDRALSHIFTLLNEIPASSRKYQFALTMADKILDDNLRVENTTVRKINRSALSSAFERTSNLLYRSLQSSNNLPLEETSNHTPWFFQALPMGSYIGKGLKICLNTFLPSAFGSLASMFFDTNPSQKTKQLTMAGGNNDTNSDDFCYEWLVVAEKQAQELLWITNKLRVCLAVDEALVQWSFATGLASLSLTSMPRVQGFIVKITVVLLGELARGEQLLEETPRQVKFRLLLLWLPLLCYASNGVSYPVLSGLEKAETEKFIEEVISSLPFPDQEVILTNWFQDFTSSSSDWPNLQRSYDQWCRSSRSLLLT